MPHAFLIAMALILPSPGDDPPKAIHVVSPKADGVDAIGLNGRGDLVYFEWVEDEKKPGLVSQIPFYLRGKEPVAIPLYEDYTFTAPAAVSDDGRVVGRVSKPRPRAGRAHLSGQAFVWGEKAGVHALGVLEGDGVSSACGISRDGKRISGFSQGDHRIRACVWEPDADGDGWKATALPGPGRLGSQVVAISGDGNHVTAVDDAVPCLWSKSKDGGWTREAIGDAGSLIPRAVNDSGTVVGFQHTGDGLKHAVAWTRGEGVKRLEKPPGYVRSEAYAINNEGAIVGMIDGPIGSKVGPHAFLHEKGRTRVLDEGGVNFASATAINDARQVAGVMEKPEELPANHQEPQDKP